MRSTQRARRWIVLSIVALGVPGAHAAESDIPDAWFYDGAQRPAALKALEGKPAPPLTTDAWIGDELTLSAQRGKVVILDFWATWCGPCLAAIPENTAIARKYKDDDLVFVGVHDSNSGWNSAPQVVKDNDIQYPVARDAGATVLAYHVQFWPTYVAIDRKGIVRAVGLTPDHIEDVVRLLLAESGPSDLEIAQGFGPEFYYGGARRPESLRAVEGKPAPALSGDEWIGPPLPPARWKHDVVVMHFTAPERSVARAQLTDLAALKKEFEPQGIAFVVVTDAATAPEAANAALKAATLDLPTLRDHPPPDAASSPNPQGVNAAAFGVRYLPSTIIIDRSGVVRAAGVRTDKIKQVLERLLAEPLNEHADALH